MYSTTTLNPYAPTQAFDDVPRARCPAELEQRYQEILRDKRLHWTEHHRFERLLGTGGQGEVYLVERRGADGFTLPIAVKIFSPQSFDTAHEYDQAMERIAHVAARVAQIQQDNLLDVHNFIDRNRIRLMLMEWIDGFDLAHVLTNDMFHRVRTRVSQRRWAYLNDVVVTDGPAQPRLKPGIAVAIVRDCLAALAALHREGIVHGDIKPSNIMVKRTGNAKIIDIGSALDVENPPPTRICTPAYAAPEVLQRQPMTPQSDLASLGYVLIEMLAGQSPFAGMRSKHDLLETKLFLAQRLHTVVPHDVAVNELLMNFCRTLIAPDPTRRFGSAEVADVDGKWGAASFHRQLVKGDLAVEYDNEIRKWLAEL